MSHCRFQSDTPTSEVMGFLPIGKNEPNTCLETGMNTPMSTQNRQLESPILHGSERAKMYDDDSKRMFPSLVNINTTGEMNVPIKITGSTESKSELPNRTEKEDTATSEGVKHRISVPVCQATDNANSLLHGNAPIHKRTPLRTATILTVRSSGRHPTHHHQKINRTIKPQRHFAANVLMRAT